MNGSNRDSPQSRLYCVCPRRINKDDPCNLHCRDTKYQPVSQPLPQAPPPPPPAILPSQNHDQKSLLVTGMAVMASVLSSVLLLCIFYAIVRFYFNNRINHSRRRSLPDLFFVIRDDFWLDEDQILPNLDNPIWYINTVGLQQSVIDSITVFKYKRDEGVIEGTECSVCLNEFQEEESLRLLPKCSHGFHIPCIDTWLRSHQNCPLCRAPVVCQTIVAQTREETDETGVQNDVREGGTSEEVEVEDGDTSENTRKVLGRSVSNVSSDLDGIQATRRSVSLDLCSASEIASEATAKHKHGRSLDTEIEELNYSKGKFAGKRSRRGSSSFGKLMKSTSIGRSISKGPVPIKRSFSCGGIFLNRSKGQGSILPL